MSVAVLNASTVTEFIKDTEAFENTVNECFKMIDVDSDGVISRDELRGGIGRIFSLEYKSKPQEEIHSLYNTIFDRFDEDQNGNIDRHEFKKLMKEILLALASGIGNSPVLVALHQGSVVMMAAEHESATM